MGDTIVEHFFPYTTSSPYYRMLYKTIQQSSNLFIKLTNKVSFRYFKQVLVVDYVIDHNFLCLTVNYICTVKAVYINIVVIWGYLS